MFSAAGSDAASSSFDFGTGAVGLLIQEFGGGTVLITSYPALLGNRPPQTILKAVVDHLTQKDRVPTREQLFNNLLSLAAA